METKIVRPMSGSKEFSNFKILLFCLLAFVACKPKESNRSSDAKKDELKIGKNGESRDSKIEKPVNISDTTAVILDSGVNGLFLSNENSITKALGDISPLINFKVCECLVLLNNDKSQYLQLHHENGGGKNSYDIFTVGYTREYKGLLNHSKTLDISIFLTENNIQLGISEQDFLQKYNRIKFKIKQVGAEKIFSFYNDSQTYIAEYNFYKGSLIRLTFGYDNS